MERYPKIIMTGGGSGGHLSVIKALVQYMKSKEVSYPIENILVVGGKLGMIKDPGKSVDERWIPTFGVSYKFIRGGKFHRGFWKFTPKQGYYTFKLFIGFFAGLIDSYKVIKDFNPEIIFATGGYVTLPMVIIGRFIKRKIIIHEQTLTTGISNKLSSKFANKILLTFEESKKHFPENKCEVVGNIVRPEIFNSDQKLAPQDLVNKLKKWEERKIIYLTGGSQGARKINQFIEENVEEIIKNNYSIIWQTGENEYFKEYERIQKTIENSSSEVGQNIYITKFVKEEIGYVLENSDMVITRAGINTLYELAAINKKSIIIPLPMTSKSDQYTNAKWFTQNFTGRLIEQKDLEIKNFLQNLDTLIQEDFKGKVVSQKGVEKLILSNILE